MGIPQMGLLHPKGFDYIHPHDPTINENPPTLHQTWLNSTTGEVFTCIDNTIDANVWRGQNHGLIELQQTSGDDIVINFPAEVKNVEILCRLKGTSTTLTSVYCGVNQDYSASYDRRYYELGGGTKGFQPSNVPGSGKISSYGITRLDINLSVSPLGVFIATLYARRSSDTTVNSEIVDITKDSVTSISSFGLHLADTNNQFLAGSQVFYKVLTW